MRQILFQIGKNFYGIFSDFATGQWTGLLESYAMSRVVPAFQIRQNFHRRRTQIWTAFHVNGRRSRSESAYCDSSNRRLIVREVVEEVRICKSSCHLILTEKLMMRLVAAKFVPDLLARHSLSMNFPRSMRRLLSPSRPTLQIWPLWRFSCSRSGNPH